jgi:hypothetical protein
VKKRINNCGYALGLANTERAIELLEQEPEKKAFQFDPRLSSIKQALMFSSVSYAPYCVAYKTIHQKRFSQIFDQNLKAGRPIDALAIASEFLKKNRMPAQNRVTRYTREQIREILATLNEVVRMREISRYRMGVATYQFVETIYEAVKNKTEDQLLNTNWTDFTHSNPLIGWNTLMWYMDCAEMKNKDILEIFAKYPEFRRIQTQAQIEMNKARDVVLEKFRQKEPGCTPKIVSFPYLFNHQQGKHLFEAAEMVSTFPNTTNSEILGENILVPDPSNSTLRKDIEKTLKNIGYVPQFIDTNYQHALFGNLHCSTHAFRYCRP